MQGEECVAVNGLKLTVRLTLDDGTQLDKLDKDGDLFILGTTEAQCQGPEGEAEWELRLGRGAISRKFPGHYGFRLVFEPVDEKLRTAHPRLTAMSEPFRSVTKILPQKAGSPRSRARPSPTPSTVYPPVAPGSVSAASPLAISPDPSANLMVPVEPAAMCTGKQGIDHTTLASCPGVLDEMKCHVKRQRTEDVFSDTLTAPLAPMPTRQRTEDVFSDTLTAPLAPMPTRQRTEDVFNALDLDPRLELGDLSDLSDPYHTSGFSLQACA